MHGTYRKQSFSRNSLKNKIKSGAMLDKAQKSMFIYKVSKTSRAMIPSTS